MADLSPAQRKVFTDTNFVALAATGRDGTPRAVVLWVDADGDEIIVNGTRTRDWLRNLQRSPSVALTIFDRQDPYRRVTVLGNVTEITDEGADDHYGRLMQKYRGVEAYQERLRREGRVASEPRTIVRIRPERITSRGID